MPACLLGTQEYAFYSLKDSAVFDHSIFACFATNMFACSLGTGYHMPLVMFTSQLSVNPEYLKREYQILDPYNFQQVNKTST